MFATMLRKSLTKGMLLFAAIAVLSAYYFGQVEVGGFPIGLGYSTLQTERGIDEDAYDKSARFKGWQ